LRGVVRGFAADVPTLCGCWTYAFSLALIAGTASTAGSLKVVPVTSLQYQQLLCCCQLCCVLPMTTLACNLCYALLYKATCIHQWLLGILPGCFLWRQMLGTEPLSCGPSRCCCSLFRLCMVASIMLSSLQHRRNGRVTCEQQ
jgi:hypothetical protein